MAQDWPCPHCGSPKMDRGYSGLDQCHDCHGLSRVGKAIAVRDGRPFYENVIILNGGDVPADDRLRDFLNSIAVNFDNPAVIYVPDSMTIDTLDEAEMARCGWYREAALRDAYRAGLIFAADNLGSPIYDHDGDGTALEGPVESADEVVARLSMRGTDGISTEEEADGAAADNQG